MSLIKRKIFNYYQILSGSSVVSVDINENLGFERIAPDDFKNCPMMLEKNRLDKFLSRISDGHHCFGHINKKTGEIASYFWITSGQNAPFVFNVQAEINENIVYIWDCRVSETMRNQGLYAHGLQNLAINNKGKCAVIVCEIKNTPSNKGIIKAGFEKFSSASFYNVLGLTFGISPKLRFFNSHSVIKL